MTEEEGENHLKDQLFHGLRPKIHNLLQYMYDKSDSQYSKLVMAARKAKTETLGGGVLEASAKSAMVKLETQPKVASFWSIILGNHTTDHIPYVCYH